MAGAHGAGELLAGRRPLHGERDLRTLSCHPLARHADGIGPAVAETDLCAWLVDRPRHRRQGRKEHRWAAPPYTPLAVYRHEIGRFVRACRRRTTLPALP